MGELAYIDYCRNINLDLLEMIGSGYVIDHVVAEHNKRAKDEAYRIYVGDLLKCLAETWGAQIPYRYADMIAPQEEEQKSGDEVAIEVITKLGLKGKTDGLHEVESDTVA